MEKIIKQCPLYGGRYWASADGKVYLDAEGKEEVRVFDRGDGHLCTTTREHALIHRCVWFAFNPTSPNKGYDVHHKNFTPTDNRLENLELLTISQHMSLHKNGMQNLIYGKTGKDNHMYGRTNDKHPRSKPIRQYTKEGVFVAEYPCAREARRVTGVSHGNISKVCKHKRPSAGGYVWRFADDPLPPKNNLTLF